MELEEMKAQWENMSQELDKQKLLTDRIVVDMTRRKFKEKLRGISVPETVGTVICFAMAIFLILNFTKLDTWYLILCGILSIGFCITLPILSMRSIGKMKKIDISDSSYRESLEQYAREKNLFVKIQKTGYYGGFIFALTILPAIGKITRDKDFLMESRLWIWYIPLIIIFHFLFSKWVFKHYSAIAKSATNLLEDLRK